MSIKWISSSNKRTLKLAELVEPLQGQFVGVEQGTYSPMYCIETASGLKKVLGSKDLTDKMSSIPLGSVVIIQLEKLVELRNGNTMAIAKVGIVTEDAEDQNDSSNEQEGEDALINCMAIPTPVRPMNDD